MQFVGHKLARSNSVATVIIQIPSDFYAVANAIANIFFLICFSFRNSWSIYTAFLSTGLLLFIGSSSTKEGKKKKKKFFIFLVCN